MSADPRLLELFARAFADDGSIARDAAWRRLPADLNWATLEETLASFIEGLSPVERTPARLRAMLAVLHLRASLLPASLLPYLGVQDEQGVVLHAIEAAFPPQSRLGRALLEALLDDESAFRPVSENELEAARASAARDDWRRISDAEIENAFAMNSVYIWLDATTWVFYLPAFLTYAIRHPASNCEFHTLVTLLEHPPGAPTSPFSDAQQRAIALFLELVAADQPWDPLFREHHLTIRAWLALLR